MICKLMAFASHNQLHMCVFSDTSLVKQNTRSDLKKQIKWHGCFSKCIFTSHLLLLTLSVRS